MLQNYFKVALRNIVKQKFYTSINIIGLSLGLATSLLIYLWIQDELDKNAFHEKADRIYYLFANSRNGTETLTWPTTPGPLSELLEENVPEIEATCRIDVSERLFVYENTSLLPKGAMADPAFFSIFSFPILAGDAQNPLPDINSVAISQALAARFFPNGDALGKVFKVSRNLDMKVTAIYQTMPAASSFQYDFILPFEIRKQADGSGFNWDNFNFQTFYLIHESADAAAVNQKVNEVFYANNPEVIDENGEPIGFFYAQNLLSFYTHNRFENGYPIGGRITYIRIFGLVALFILLLACINFMNLATARASMRAKEVGVRKSIGAGRGSLVAQFLGESILLTLFSVTVALIMVSLLLPHFNTLVSKSIELPVHSMSFWILIFVLTSATGLMAGVYPAMVLSGFQPLQVLKGATLGNVKGVNLRRMLVVFQFALSSILLVAMVVIYGQLNFINNKHLGYDKDQLMTLTLTRPISSSFDAFRNQITAIEGVEFASRANQHLMPVENSSNSITWQGKAEDDNRYVRALVVDHYFLETAGFILLDGRFFSPMHNDTNMFVVSKSLAERMQMENIIGASFSLWGIQGTIVGVVDDFHSRSLQENMDPIVFMLTPNWTNTIYIRHSGMVKPEMLSSIERVYKEFEKEVPFELHFMDQKFDQLYKSESVMGKLSGYFTGMALFISSLGLLGLTAFMAERKTREIGIRKVMGAASSDIVMLLCRDFLVLVLFAWIISMPIAYFYTENFLSQYAYRIELDAWVFVLTGLVIILIAMFTVSVQSIKAASANPVKALKVE